MKLLSALSSCGGFSEPYGICNSVCYERTFTFLRPVKLSVRFLWEYDNDDVQQILRQAYISLEPKPDTREALALILLAPKPQTKEQRTFYRPTALLLRSLNAIDNFFSKIATESSTILLLTKSNQSHSEKQIKNIKEATPLTHLPKLFSLDRNNEVFPCRPPSLLLVVAFCFRSLHLLHCRWSSSRYVVVESLPLSLQRLQQIGILLLHHPLLTLVFVVLQEPGKSKMR